MKINRVFDYEIDNVLRKEIQELLFECFETNYPKEREYFKQLPHFRYLVFDEDNANKLVAQVGLDYRVMNLNGKPVKVLGIIDLCVIKGYRSRGLGSMLLSEIDKSCQNKSIDFLLLFADDKNLYLKNGYRSVENKCKWLKIDNEKQSTLGIGFEVINELMIKETGNKKWEYGDIDLLGYLY
ncbi:GNAT family N-acetyltransferase [Fictibacillus sp. KIGAM418]|uniref:GNAT family N-acetyltransferase n=1 Tax=Fictibacillus marinisediminis TaxID=2878389 RepID=A0A9X1XB84_9BACL|nr:GNAT family N-acetyltransferase [Fictibacillus marinisediminis]MCK6257388.1 GNAT family N-acetyltransferase [Fictibacillus marinisediminis]